MSTNSSLTPSPSLTPDASNGLIAMTRYHSLSTMSDMSVVLSFSAIRSACPALAFTTSGYMSSGCTQTRIIGAESATGPLCGYARASLRAPGMRDALALPARIISTVAAADARTAHIKTSVRLGESSRLTIDSTPRWPSMWGRSSGKTFPSAKAARSSSDRHCSVISSPRVAD